MSGPWENYQSSSDQTSQDGPWAKYATATIDTTPGGLPSAQSNVSNAAQNVMTSPNFVMPQPGSQVEENTLNNKIKDIADTIRDPHNLNGRMYDAFGSGLGQLASGIEQIYGRNVSDIDPITGKPGVNAEAARAAAASNQLQNQVESKNPMMGEIMNMAPKALSLLPAGTSKAALLGGGALLGATTPTVTPEQQAQYPTQPVQTGFDRAMQPIGAFNNSIANLVTDPNSTGGKSLQGLLGAGETMGATKVAGDILKPPSNIQAITPQAIEEAITPAYEKATKSGQVFAPNDLSNKFAQDINDAIPKASANGQLLEGDSYLNNILQKYTGYENKPLGIVEADKIDKDLTGNIQRAYKAGYNHEAGQLSDIQDNFRNQMNQAPAGADLSQARGLAAANFKMRDLQAIKDNAESAKVPSTAIKTGANTLYKRIQKNPAGWTDDEISAIDNARKIGLLTDALNTVGSKLISGIVGGTAGLFGGGLHGALAGAAAGEAAGFPLRAAANSIQRGKLNDVMDAVAQRPAVQRAFGAKPDIPSLEVNPDAIHAEYDKLHNLQNIKDDIINNIQNNSKLSSSYKYQEPVKSTPIPKYAPKYAPPDLDSAIDEWGKLKELERHLKNTVDGTVKFSNQQGGFWRGKSITQAAEDAKNLNNIKQQIANHENLIANIEQDLSKNSDVQKAQSKNKIIDNANQDILSANQRKSESINNAASDAQNLFNIKKQITDQLQKIDNVQKNTRYNTPEASIIEPSSPTPSSIATRALIQIISKPQGAAAQAEQQLQPKQDSIQIPQKSNFADQKNAPDVASFVKPESGGDINAKNPKSTATGPYQFTNKTWANMVLKYGKQSGIGMADKDNPQAQATMARLYALDNIDTLKPALGRMPTKGELYMAHVFGADGAKTLINAPANKEAALLFPRNVIDGNHNIFFDKQTKQPRTASQVYALLNNKIN